MSNVTLTDIAVQLATLDTKMDNVIETISQYKKEKEELEIRVDSMEKFHYKVMGGLGATTALGAFLAWFSGVYHDFFK